MKTGLTRLAVLIFILGGTWRLGMVDALAELEVSAAVQINAAADFYEPLTFNGNWVEVGRYGRCWHPTGVVAGWRPYCDGFWVWTDCGWYWQSDEPWAWACYHYGSWVYDPTFGWVWVPGVEWAPAWVYWRIGGGYIGWAPCSPRGGVIGSSSFVFVDESHFHDRHRPSNVIANDEDILSHTRQTAGNQHERRIIGNREQTVVVNNGPDLKAIQKATGLKYTAISIREADRRTPVPQVVKHRQAGPSGGTKAATVQMPAGPALDHPHISPQSPPEPGFLTPGKEEKNNPGDGHERDRDKDR